MTIKEEIKNTNLEELESIVEVLNSPSIFVRHKNKIIECNDFWLYIDKKSIVYIGCRIGKKCYMFYYVDIDIEWSTSKDILQER